MRVMIYDSVLADVLSLEAACLAGDCAVVKAISGVGIWDRLRFFSPDVLLFEPFSGDFDVDDFFEHLSEYSEFESLMTVVCSGRGAEDLHHFCMVHDLHGYFMKDLDSSELVPFLRCFFED